MEMETKNKRKRSENWDATDKILLRQLIEEKISKIENKCVDTNTTKSKREAWKEIINTFNKCSNVQRNLTQIQCQWRATKMEVKSRASKHRKQISATGGGPPPKSPDPEDAQLMALIPFEFEVDNNEFDCDAPDPMDAINESTAVEVEYLIEEMPQPLDLNKHVENRQFPPLHCPSVSPNCLQEQLLLEEAEDDPANLTVLQTRRDPSASTRKKRKAAAQSDEQMKLDLYELTTKIKRRELEMMEAEHEEKMKILKLQGQHMEESINNSQQEHHLRLQLLLEKQKN